MDIEVKMPDIGLDEVEVIDILVTIDEKVEAEQGLIIVEGDKASMEIPSPISGIIKNICINIGDKVKTDFVIMFFKSDITNSYINKEQINIIEPKKDFLSSNIDVNSKNDLKKNFFVHATPIIRRLARNLNIDLKNIIGTGPKNRILKEDIELYKKEFCLSSVKDRNIVDINNESTLKIETVKLSKIQKIIGDNLHKNWINIPHVTQFDEVNITTLEEFRQKYNFENQKEKKNNITILVFIIKVVAHALEKFPIFNSSLTSNNENIILKKYINIGIAVDVEKSLYVPVLKDVDKKNIKQLSSELILLSEKARKRKLSVSDMKEGCFTISNLGGIGGGWFSPIINSPEVAILGISRSQIKPVWNGKEFVPSLMLPLSLSYDHRLINGADAARFITFIKKLLSDLRFLIM